MNKDLAEWVKEGNLDEIEELRKRMNDDDEFSKQLCPLITTSEQYKALSERFKDHGMGPIFFVHGDIEIVKQAVAEERRYDDDNYIRDGDLERALPLALDRRS